MRKKMFRSIDDVLSSNILTKETAGSRQRTDRVLQSTKLEDKVYAELRKGDTAMDSLEDMGSAKLPGFAALSRDIYQSFYSLNVRRRSEEELSETAKVVNSHIIDNVTGSEDYHAIKAICEGRKLPAYDAAVEFTERVTDGLDSLLEAAAGDNNMLNALENAVRYEEKLKNELEKLLEKRVAQPTDAELDKRVLDTANRLSSKAEQIQAMERHIHDSMVTHSQDVAGLIASATQAAAEKAEETALMMAAWGQSEDSSPEQMELDRDTFNRVRGSKTLLDVSRYLGRFKEMLAQLRKNSYTYGRGEKYSLEYGNRLGGVITSEFAMLATPEAMPLFLRKYQSKRLKQYKRRDAIYKGSGDIIMCLDESGSTRAEASWGKAVALALLDVAAHDNRKFALIHFSGESNYRTDIFIPGAYSTQEILNAAECFLNGGTDYETPLREALRLISDEAFENADIVFTTDGACKLPDGFTEQLRQAKASQSFKISGILLDAASPGFDFSLTPFCDDIYRTSEIAQDGIVKAVLSARA